MQPSPKRLLPKIIDFNATTHPNKVYAVFPRSRSFSNGFRELTYQGFANAINRISWWWTKLSAVRVRRLKPLHISDPKMFGIVS